MTANNPILPETSFAEMAAFLLLELRGLSIKPQTEFLIAGIDDDNSRRAVSQIVDLSRKETDVMAAIYKLVIALEPYEAALRPMIEQLHLQSQRDRKVTSQECA